MEKFECPAEGYRCKHCVFLAREAFIGIYLANGWPEENAQEFAENTRLESLVNDLRLPTDMSCANRRHRAEEIGFSQAERQVRPPGDDSDDIEKP